MRNKQAVKENQARRRLLRFSLFTLGGAAVEGSMQCLAEEGMAEEETEGKKAVVIAA
ncbi:hypothetical protein [Erwinia sorbitola]|uniref:hypothetical protein n=1 Tax=Erwinia sorbitola TaxID=2681984 RepID=UPI0018A9B2D9|nr:hypothetical protein [Erwinia sorbitola]